MINRIFFILIIIFLHCQNNVKRENNIVLNKSIIDFAQFNLYLANINTNLFIFSKKKEDINIEMAAYQIDTSFEKSGYKYIKNEYKGDIEYNDIDSILIIYFNIYLKGLDEKLNKYHDLDYNRSIMIDTFTNRIIGFGEHTTTNNNYEISKLIKFQKSYKLDSTKYSIWINRYIQNNLYLLDTVEKYPNKVNTELLKELYTIAKYEAYYQFFDSQVNLRNKTDKTNSSHYFGQLDLGINNECIDYQIENGIITFKFSLSNKGISLKNNYGQFEIKLNLNSKKIINKEPISKQRQLKFNEFIHNVGNSWLLRYLIRNSE